MRISDDGAALVLADTPVGRWLLGLAFVASGTAALVGAAVGLGGPASLPWWVRPALALIGLSHLAGGLWFVRQHPATRTRFDLARGVGEHRVWAPGSRAARVTDFPLAAVRALDLHRARADDGDATVQLHLRLRDGRRLPLEISHAAAAADSARGARLETAVAALRARLLPAVGAER